MKKLVAILLAGLMTLAMAACGGSPAPSAAGSGSPSASGEAPVGGGELVIYTPITDAEIERVVYSFEEQYGVTVKIISGSVGECMARVQAEIDNPQGDVVYGGLTYSSLSAYPGCFEEYVSVNDSKLPESFQNTNGYITGFTTQLEVLVTNNDLLQKLGVEVKGFDDLLQPQLKGKIIYADPTSSSNAWNLLLAMLIAHGGYESDEAWEFVAKLIDQLEGTISSSSSAVFRTVNDGEYAVGLTYEEVVADLLNDGSTTVTMVYPQEGTLAVPFYSAVIKNAKNMDNAKLFIDWIISDEMQAGAAHGTARPANLSIPVTCPHMADISTIKVIYEDQEATVKSRDAILKRWSDLWAAAN